MLNVDRLSYLTTAIVFSLLGLMSDSRAVGLLGESGSVKLFAWPFDRLHQFYPGNQCNMLDTYKVHYSERKSELICF